MRKLVTVLLLQVYAAALAVPALLGGIRTDEAKYLLNIPYPHPPLARTLLETTYGFAWNEVLWRLVFATLMVQAVWLVVRLALRAGPGARVLLAAAWLLSGAVVLQAPTIMMAPLTALGGLVLLWAAARPRSAFGCFLAAMFWFASVFVAYQSVLFLPVVIAMCLRSGQSKRRTILYAFGPLFALALYTLGNPLALQSIVGLGADKIPLGDAARGYLWSWLLAGSVFGSVFGSIGTLRGRPELGVTFLLLSAYMIASYHDYYAVFLAPVFVANIAHLLDMNAGRLRPLDNSVTALSVCVGIGCVVAVLASLLVAGRANAARDTMKVLAPQILSIDRTDVRMLIVGDFGHEWQYYAPPHVREILKYSPQTIAPDADVVVCWRTCDSKLLEGKDSVPNVPVESWIRRDAALHM